MIKNTDMDTLNVRGPLHRINETKSDTGPDPIEESDWYHNHMNEIEAKTLRLKNNDPRTNIDLKYMNEIEAKILRLSEMPRSQDENKQCKTETSKLRSDITKLQDENEQCKTKTSKLQSEMSNLRNGNEPYGPKMSELRLKITKLQDENLRLKSNLSRLTPQNVKPTDRQSKVRTAR